MGLLSVTSATPESFVSEAVVREVLSFVSTELAATGCLAVGLGAMLAVVNIKESNGKMKLAQPSLMLSKPKLLSCSFRMWEMLSWCEVDDGECTRGKVRKRSEVQTLRGP